MTTLPPLLIGKHIARYPIIQGGMGIRISGANLAGAVANAGGIGIVSAVGLGLNSPYFACDVENGLIFAGSNAGRAECMMSVAELIGELVS